MYYYIWKQNDEFAFSLMYEKMIFPVYNNVYVLLKISFNILDERQLKINSSYNHESAHPCCCFGLYPFHNFISYRYLILNFYVLWQRNLSKIQRIKKTCAWPGECGFLQLLNETFLHTIDLKWGLLTN